MRNALLGLIIAAFAGWAAADGEKSGEFDYYVMSLSWSPNWCLREGDARASEQCEDQHDHGWILHGLWPQYHRGWPAYCPTATPPPSRSMTRSMMDIMGASGLAWHQWKKHGTCSGLTAEQFFDLSRVAYAQINRPPVFRVLDKPVELPAQVVEEAFLEANPALEADMITITCKAGQIEEARICLSRALDPVPCGRDVIKDCTMTDALLTPVR